MIEAPKVVDLDQRSQEWHDWRNGVDIDGPRITATAASVILGNNPYKTPHRLWLQMTGQAGPDPVNPAMLRGQKYETPALKAFTKRFGGSYIPTCVEHPRIPWAASSLDGLSLLGDEILEIKVPGSKVLILAQYGIVPAHYYTQIQWQLFCTRLSKKAHFWAYDPDARKGYRVEVHPDPLFQDDLLRRCEAFRQCVLTKVTPAGNAWVDAALRWRQIKEQIAEDQHALDEIEKELIALMPPTVKRHEGGGVSVTRVKTTPKVDWASLLESQGLSLEAFLKDYAKANGIPLSALDEFRRLDVDGFLASRKTKLSILGEMFVVRKGLAPDALERFTRIPDPRFSFRGVSVEELPVESILTTPPSMGYPW